VIANISVRNSNELIYREAMDDLEELFGLAADVAN